MESDQIQSFNDRLSQWISSQGFWFQLRYSMAGGSYSSATFHFLRLLFRLFLFLLVAAAITGVYLVKRVDAADYPGKLAASFRHHLEATEAKVEGFKRVQGVMNLRKLICTGGENAFYSTFTASNVRCDMNLVDGLIGTWKPGTISVADLEINVRAGADDMDTASRQAGSFLKTFEGVDAHALEISRATIRWGYSERTQGMIEGSRLFAKRIPEGWRLQFQGGKFTQNWLRNLEIVRLVVLADASGLKVEESELVLKSGSGVAKVVLKDLNVAGGDRPAVSGMVEVSKMPLDALLRGNFEGMLDGVVSGEFRVAGSTNSPDGIGFTGDVHLRAGDHLTLRDGIPLLRAIGTFDDFNGYRRIDFNEGSFTVKTGGGITELRDVNLRAGNSFGLQGRLRVRPPTPSETEALLRRPTGSSPLPIFSRDGQGEGGDAREKDAADGRDEDTRATVEGKGKASLEEQGRQAIRKTFIYEGEFKFSIPGNAFDRVPEVRLEYPLDLNSKRIVLDVPIVGTLEELTLRQAEAIYVKGSKRE